MCMSMYIGLFYFGFLIHEQLLIFYKKKKKKEIKYFNLIFNFFHIFLQGTCTGVSIFKIFISKLQGMCTEVLIFKIFVCFVLQLQQTVWTLDLKCSQRPKCEYLWSPHACWVLCVMFAFMSCHLVFTFMYLVYIWFPYFVIIILFISLSYYLKKKKNTFMSCFLIFLLFCSQLILEPFQREYKKTLSTHIRPLSTWI